MIKKLFLHNLSLKIIAIFLALFIYFYVMSELSPVIRKTFLLEPEIKNLREDLIIISDIPQITVELSGNKQLINLLTKANVKTFLDFKGKDIGDHNLKVQLIAPENVELVSIDPKNIIVKLDKLIEKDMKVEINKIGKLQPNYEITDSKLDIDTVRVIGPQKYINEVEHVITTVNLNSLTNSLNDKVSLRAINKIGDEIKNVVIKPNEVRLKLEITPVIHKEVEIQPNIVGEVAPGYYIDEVKVYPKRIMIKGPENKIRNINILNTTPIYLNDTDKNLEYDAQIEKKEGITMLSSDIVRVSIIVKKEEE